MKHLHMLMAFLTIGLFVYQSYLVLSRNDRLGKRGKIITHIFYTLLILSGGWMLTLLMSVNAPVQWVFAKIILLIAAISASIKAFRASATPAQQKMGIFITAVAYVGILFLAFSKPANFF
ncbi:SirB2 family protein [Psychrobacter sp. I-STPA10]|uniref:SirB2 family protein n=1 Tax=Psychrobacter sp. I-STPA10 TaxID=2585769 RepID=UPI001E3A6052|nr:SirB2 family protein [Psychrobacter sp. I-STPA10]